MVANFTFKFLAVTGYSRNKSTRLVWRSHPREKTAQRFVLTNLNITLTGNTWVNSSEHCEKQKQKKKNIWLQWKLCFLNLRHCQARREAEGFLLQQTRKQTAVISTVRICDDIREHNKLKRPSFFPVPMPFFELNILSYTLCVLIF